MKGGGEYNENDGDKIRAERSDFADGFALIVPTCTSVKMEIGYSH